MCFRLVRPSTEGLWTFAKVDQVRLLGSRSVMQRQEILSSQQASASLLPKPRPAVTYSTFISQDIMIGTPGLWPGLNSSRPVSLIMKMPTPFGQRVSSAKLHCQPCKGWQKKTIIASPALGPGNFCFSPMAFPVQIVQ